MGRLLDCRQTTLRLATRSLRGKIRLFILSCTFLYVIDELPASSRALWSFYSALYLSSLHSPVLVRWWPAARWPLAGLTGRCQTPVSRRWIPWLLLPLPPPGWPEDSSGEGEDIVWWHQCRCLQHNTDSYRCRFTGITLLFIVCGARIGQLQWGLHSPSYSSQRSVLLDPVGGSRVGRSSENRRAAVNKWPFYHSKCFLWPPGLPTGRAESFHPQQWPNSFPLSQ